MKSRIPTERPSPRRSAPRAGRVRRRGPPRGVAGTRRAGAAPPSGRSKTIGIQVGAVSFVDEGVEQVLDILQERGRVDTIYLTTFTYGRGLAGRQVPGQPFPDHGVQESDEAFFHGGNYARPHPQYLPRHHPQGDPRARPRRPRHRRDGPARGEEAGTEGLLLGRGRVAAVGPGLRPGGRGRPPGPQGRDALPHEPGRAPLLDGAGHRPLLVVRHRRHPLLQRAQRPAAQCDRLEPLRSRSPRRARPASASTTGRPRGSTASTSSGPGRGT